MPPSEDMGAQPGLPERSQLIEMALGASGDGIAIVDGEGRLIFANELGCLAAMGMAGAPPFGQGEVTVTAYPGGQPVLPGDMPLALALRGQAGLRRGFAFTYPDGRQVVAWASASLVRDRQGRIVGAICVLRDVTEHKRVEEQHQQLLRQVDAQRRLLQAVLDNMIDSVLVCDPKGHFILANRAHQRLAGYDIAREGKGGVADMPRLSRNRRLDGTPIPAEQLAVYRALMGECVADEEQLIYNPALQRDLCIRISASPIRNEQGEIEGAVVVARDVTDLMELDQLKERIISTASHELKTPLTVIKGYAQVLLRWGENLPPPQRQMLEYIDRGADRVNKVVLDMLQVSRLHLGHPQLQWERLDLGVLVEQAVEQMAMATGRNIRLNRGQSAVVLADRRHLEQALDSLLDNAVKFSPAGGDVEVALVVEGELATVSIKDYGVGIPRDKQHRIFERFYRAHASTPYSFGGLGVGLTICQEIIGHHHGRLWFESEEGKGSTFSFCLPLERPTTP